MRSRRDRDEERRRNVEQLVQPGNGAVLSRRGGQPISLLGLWSAARQRSGGDADAEQLARAEFSRLAADGGGRRERLRGTGSSECRRDLRRVGGAAGFWRGRSAVDAADADASRRVPADVDTAAGFFSV